MSDLNLKTTVGQWVARRPEVARVFEELQIDYCCGGSRQLGEAIDARGLITAEVLRRLNQPAPPPGEADHGWLSAPLAQLCDHIEETHHRYLRSELPRLEQLIAKVVAAHGAKHPELRVVQRAFAQLRAELEPHMMKEERILFPAIRQMEQNDSAIDFPFGTVANPIRMMEQEHDGAGNALTRLRRLTGNFALPDDGCNTYRVMLEGLRKLESDLHQHIHKENNILFPRALETEKELAAARG